MHKFINKNQIEFEHVIQTPGLLKSINHTRDSCGISTDNEPDSPTKNIQQLVQDKGINQEVSQNV